MELIACDLGNTALKCALMQKGTRGWEVRDFWKGTADDASRVTLSKASTLGLPVVLMSVRNSGLAEEMVRALRDEGAEAHQISMDHASSVRMEVDRSTVGIDRVCNAVAAAARLSPGMGAIVVDAGTAITLEVVAPDGTFVGGAIAPGPDAAMDGLFMRAPRLSSFRPQAPPATYIGRTTAEALGIGRLVGTAGAMDALIGTMREEVDFDVEVIGTGGAMPQFLDLVPSIDSYVPHLTLEGVAMLAEAAGLV